MSLRYLVLIILTMPFLAKGETLFYEDFQQAHFKGWKFEGRGDYLITYFNGNYSLRLSNKKRAFYHLDLPIHTPITISIDITALELETNDQCIAAITLDKGKNWTTVNSITNGNDDGYTFKSKKIRIEVEVPTDSIWISLSSLGKNQFKELSRPRRPDFDFCWFDNIVVESDR